MGRRAMALSIFGGLAVAISAGPASAGEATTTRIEPRAVYGATITIEEGVRVFRPLPSEQHVIVNPGGQTPLFLGYYGRGDRGFVPGDFSVVDPR